MKFGIITKYWRHGASVALAVVLAMLGILFPVHIEIGPSPGSSIGINQGMFRIVIGNKVSAQAANYTCDGINDDVEFQQALDALPDIGGQLLVLAGVYNFTDATTVTRDIPNVTILGIGASVIFSGDGSTPIFTAGDDRWLFSNFQTDAGGLEMGATTNWLWVNVIINGILYSLEPTVTDMGDLIDAVEGDISTLQSTVTGMNATLVQHGINISALQGDVATLEGDVAILEADVDALQGNMTSMNTTVNWHTGNISALQSAVSDLQGDLSDLQSDLSDVQSDLAAVQGNLTALNVTVNYHSGNISALQADLAAINTTVNLNTGNITLLWDNLTALNVTVNYHSGNISALQSSVTVLEGNVTTMQGNITSMNETINWHSGNISALQADLAALNNTLTWHTGNSTGVHGVTGTVLGTEDVNDTPTDGNTTNPISSNWAYDHVNSNVTIAIIYVIDGGGSAITTGVKGFLEIPFACTVTGWTLTADQSGSIVIDVWKDTYANFPPAVADTIAGSEKPTLSSVQKNQDLSLSTWTTAVASGSHLGFNVDSASTVTRITLTIRAVRVIP